MDRMACVNLPVFPVQLLLRKHPGWQSHPVAVVDSDRPQGTILWVNERARSCKILPGMRYAAGLALAASLHAAVVAKKEIDSAVRSLSAGLRSFSPRVEPATAEPGVFWIDASGLERLHGSLNRWARRIRSDMYRAGFLATVVVGFDRFGTYALAKTRPGILVLEEPEEERLAAQGVPLDRLALEPATRDVLTKLGIKTVGQLIDLPSEGIVKRFGRKAHRLHHLASGQLRLPLQAEKPQPLPKQRRILDHPENDTARLMVVIERLLHPLLKKLTEQAHALSEVQIRLRFERLGDHMEKIRPAAPTLDGRQLLELIRLRFETVRELPDGVVEVVLLGRSVPDTPEQHRLLGPRPKRDLAAANRALARVRAELGEGAVVRARLHEGHLPEGRFIWEPLDTLPAPKFRNVDTGRLIRRIYARPIPLQPRQRQEPDGWILLGLEQGPVVREFGPYIVSGGWWNRLVHREYYFAETREGDFLWMYYDRGRRLWFLQGRVE
ncbi:MAG: DNA polymerase Y family protein [Candidatus Zixiibacteriota bacterium]|nr:MAG: DNA polymerase Y family protein [candidate division Zixibacteria bacterium]